jgi:hypothetical protein
VSSANIPVSFAEDQRAVDLFQSPFGTFGALCGAGSVSGGWGGVFGVSTHLKRSAFNSDELGRWDGGAILYFFTQGPVTYTAHVFGGYELLPSHEIAIGPLLGVSYSNSPTNPFAFTYGVQIAFNVATASRVLITSTISVISGPRFLDAAVPILALEIRYGWPIKRTTSSPQEK